MEELELLLLQHIQSISGNAAGPIVLACSGGADSTALLALAASIKGFLPESSFFALHIDHQLRSREELEAEQQLLEKNANSLSVPLHLERIAKGAVQKMARQDGIGIEAAARELRYQRFESFMKQVASSLCLLAHTRDDQVETVIQRFFEGAGSDAMGGIPYRRGPYLRPLLDVSRSELLRYLELRNIRYSTDSSNNDTSLLRNRIRKLLLPGLEEVFPGYRRGVLRFAEKQRLIEDALDGAFPYPEIGSAPDGQLVWDAEPFFSLPQEGRRRFLYFLWERFPRVRGRLPYGLVQRIMRMDSTGERVVEAGGMRLFYDGKSFFWGPVVVLEGKNGYIRQIYNGEALTIPGTGLVRFLWKGLEEPLIIRSRLEGDVITLQDGNRKRLKKIFQEWGVPANGRDSIPVLEGTDGLLALFGYCCGYKDLYGSGVVRRGTIKMEMIGESRKERP